MNLSEFMGQAGEPQKRRLSDFQAGPGVTEPPDRTVENREAERQSAPGFLERMWNGLSGKDVSRAGRFGMGMADPFYKGAQIGSRMIEAGDYGGGTPAFAFAPPSEPPGRTREVVDRAVAERERTYQEGEKRSGLSGGLSSEWARLLGNIASPVNVAAAAAGGAAAPASAAGRVGLAAGIGAATGAMEPVPDIRKGFGAETAKQALGGAVGGVAGGVIGEGAGKLVRALVGNSPEAVDAATIRRFRTAVKPGRGQRADEEGLRTQDRQILSSTDDIIAQRGRGNTPRTLRDYVTALDETKRPVFQEYDQKMQSAQDLTNATPNPHLIDPFRRSGAQLQGAQNAVREAEQAVTFAAAQQARAGNNVYMANSANATRRLADQRLAAARSVAQRIAQSHEAIKQKLYAPHIDLAPIARQLDTMMRKPQFRDVPGAAVREMQSFSGNLKRAQFYSLSQAQDVLQTLNSKLSAFYKNPTPMGASAAVSDAEVAGMLRRALDETITKLNGPGYQTLRNRYGALRQVEKDVVRAYQREANKVPGGIGGIFADLWATEAGLKAAFTLDPHSLATAMAAKGAKIALSKLRDPNRAVARMFSQRAASFGRPTTTPLRRLSRSGASFLPSGGGITGGAAGGEIMTGRDMPRVEQSRLP